MEVNQCPYTGIVYRTENITFHHIKTQENTVYLCRDSMLVYKGSKGAVKQRRSLFNTCATDNVHHGGSEENLGKQAHAWWYNNCTFAVKPLNETCSQAHILWMTKNLFKSLFSYLDEYPTTEFTTKYYNMFLNALEDKDSYPHRNVLHHLPDMGALDLRNNQDTSITVTRKISKGNISTTFDNEWDLLKNHRLITSTYGYTDPIRPYQRAKSFFEAIDATR